MNEIAQISLPFPNLPPPPPVSSLGVPIYSTPCNVMISALAKASKDILNPVKNKTVTVNSRRTGRTYTFKYATLDVVLDCVRAALSDNELVWNAAPVGDELVATLMHVSGQWMMCRADLRTEENTKEARAGAITYWRRQLLQTMTGICAEDDDDGAQADGNDIANGDLRGRWQRGDATGDWRAEISKPASDTADALIERATHAVSLDDGLGLLKFWLAHQARVEKLRGSDPQAWSGIINVVASALDRSLGGTIAVAWKAFAKASTREHERAARAKWDGDWDVTLQAFRAACPAGFNDLCRHANAAGEAIAKTPRPEALSAAAAVVAPATVAAPAEVAPQFPCHVLDWRGDIATDLMDTAKAWALSYAAIWQATEAEMRQAMTEHNTDALFESAKDPDARSILNALDHPAGDRPVVLAEAMPLDRSGNPNFALYVRRIKDTLPQLRTADDLALWIAANEPVYLADTVGSGTRARVLQMVTAAKRELGMPLPEGA
jgi:hypothetical protein